MGLFQLGSEIIGEVGFGIIKSAGRTIYGGGQAIIGLVVEDDEMIEHGVKRLGRGVFGLGVGAINKIINGDSEDENNDS